MISTQVSYSLSACVCPCDSLVKGSWLNRRVTYGPQLADPDAWVLSPDLLTQVVTERSPRLRDLSS